LVDVKRFEDSAESELYSRANDLGPAVKALQEERRYQEALEKIATLRPYVDAFFEKVMVLTDDVPVRENRLSLVTKIYFQFSSIADFSEIVTN